MSFVCEDEFDDFNDGVNCPRCHGFGMTDCRCGGDQCYCLNAGEMDCPLCHGEGNVSQLAYDNYWTRQREAQAAFHGVAFKYADES